MIKYYKILIYNFLLVFIIGCFHVFLYYLRFVNLIRQTLLILFYLLILYFILKKLKIDLKEKINKNFIINFITILLYYFSIFTVINFVFEKFNLINVTFNYSNFIDNINYFFLFPIELLIVSVLEELFFRKYIFNELAIDNNIKKLIFSSALFSISHFPDSFIGFLIFFTSSIIFGVIYIKTNRIIYSIAIHLTTNYAILIYALQNNNELEIASTTNYISFFENQLNTSTIIILISQIIILLYALYSFNLKNNTHRLSP